MKDLASLHTQGRFKVLDIKKGVVDNKYDEKNILKRVAVRQLRLLYTKLYIYIHKYTEKYTVFLQTTIDVDVWKHATHGLY